MRNPVCNKTGFALVELMVVFSIIGVLTSMAVPQYEHSRQRALKTQCNTTRHHMEMEELAYYSEYNEASLQIDDFWSCQAGGTYLWVVSDPDDPDYPQVGCSLHFAGGDTEGGDTGDDGTGSGEDSGGTDPGDSGTGDKEDPDDGKKIPIFPGCDDIYLF